MNSASSAEDLIKRIGPHSVKKFELIEKYVSAWAHKLLEYGKDGKCQSLVFIDCMCNCGFYKDDNGEIIHGTPIRVSKILSEIMHEANYQKQDALLYFNDLDKDKIELLKTGLPRQTHNFHIYTSHIDGNVLLKQIGSQLRKGMNVHYLLVYDPFEADIDWAAIQPFLGHWGEVIINHMVSDTIRATKVVTKEETKQKYSGTYQWDFNQIVSFGTDKGTFEKRIEELIRIMRGTNGQKYYIAAFPFFNSTNNLIYNLIHCTGNIEGYKLYKTTAWQTFDGCSSTKVLHNSAYQMELSFTSDDSELTTATDEYCYYVKDIAKYIQDSFRGKEDVLAEDVWEFVDEHPVFPTKGFKRQIESDLKEFYQMKVSNRPKRFTFKDRRG